MAGNRFRGLTFAGALALVAAIAAYVYFANTHIKPERAAPPPPKPAGAVAPAPARGPQFDILRVDSSGNAVIAGRADAGATITIKNGDDVIGTVTADSNGEFAFVPDHPLPPGAQQLTLFETLANGQIVQGQTSASVNVGAGPGGQSLAVITGPGGSRIVSGQGPAAGSLGLGAVDYDANGHAIFSGTASPGHHVLLTLNGVTIGSAVAGPQGRWSIVAQVPERSGTLHLSDTSAPGGPPLSAPFALETLKAALQEGHIVIAPGQNLWLIARHVYGHGILYTLIYAANATQIHNPNLIFPGQNFAIPAQKHND